MESALISKLWFTSFLTPETLIKPQFSIILCFAKAPSTLQDLGTLIKKKNGPYIIHAKWFHVKPMFNRIRDVRHQHELENLDKFLCSFTFFSCQSSLKFLQQLIHGSTNICLLWTRFDTRCLDTVLNKNRCVLCSLELAYSTILNERDGHYWIITHINFLLR